MFFFAAAKKVYLLRRFSAKQKKSS